jgi:hypothetical protein
VVMSMPEPASSSLHRPPHPVPPELLSKGAGKERASAAAAFYFSLSPRGSGKGHREAMRGEAGSIPTIGRYGAGITWPQLLQVRSSSEPKKR